MMGHRSIISESKGPLGWGSRGGKDPRPKMNFRFFTPPTCRYQLRVPKFYIVSIIPASFLSQVFDFMLMTDSSFQIYTLWITIFKVPTWGILLMQTRKWHFETCKMYFVEDQLFFRISSNSWFEQQYVLLLFLLLINETSGKDFFN
jgi:hypothetical protein